MPGENWKEVECAECGKLLMGWFFMQKEEPTAVCEDCLEGL